MKTTLRFLEKVVSCAPITVKYLVLVEATLVVVDSHSQTPFIYPKRNRTQRPPRRRMR